MKAMPWPLIEISVVVDNIKTKPFRQVSVRGGKHLNG